VERYLYHHSLINIIIKYELQKQGIEWSQFLLDNGFEDQVITGNVAENVLQVLQGRDLKNETIKMIEHILEDIDEVQEIFEISWTKK
jgi:hypothetical protein